MPLRPRLPPGARRLLDLARTDRALASRELEKLSVAEQVELLCETPLARRAELLGLLRDAAPLVRALPEAELCFTLKTVGLADAGWLLEQATASQLQACVDLDAWSEFAPDREQLDAWLGACAEAGDETLVRAMKSLDMELVVLWVKDRAEVVMAPREEGWEPPPGARTLDGQFHLVARHEKDDLADLLRGLELLFQRDYWFYFRTLQAAIHETPAELEESALRWRSGRLQDLGFPPWEEAMRVQARLGAEERRRLPEPEPRLALGEWRLPVWLPRLPSAEESGHATFRAAAELAPNERNAFFYAFVALANQVAVAERLPLGDPDSIPRALERAAVETSRGIEFLGREHALRHVDVLRRVSLGRLFRVGRSLDRPSGGA